MTKRDVEAQNEELGIRLSIARAWIEVWRKAFDALLHHGVNVRNLREYNDTTLVDEALEAKSIRDGQVAILEYLRRVENAIAAAVRRKGFKVTT